MTSPQLQPNEREAQDLERVVALEEHTPIVREVHSEDYLRGYDTGYHAGIRKTATDRHATTKRVLDKLLANGHGGGNWRRLIVQERDANQDKEPI